MLKKLFISSLSLALLVGAVYFIVRVGPDFFAELGIRRNLSETELAPDFLLRDLSDKEYRLSDFRGSPVVLYFWNSWNEISVDLLKAIEDYQNVGKAAIFAINNQEEPSVFREYVSGFGSFLALADLDGEVGYLYDVGVLPLTVFIDKTGRERARIVGPLTLEDIQNKVDLVE